MNDDKAVRVQFLKIKFDRFAGYKMNGYGVGRKCIENDHVIGMIGFAGQRQPGIAEEGTQALLLFVVLDRRIRTRGYGTTLLSTLPPAKRTDLLSEVEDFWSLVKKR